MEPLNEPWQPIADETPIDPSHLKDCSIRTREELNRAEALNITKAHIKYLAGGLTQRIAPFNYAWLLQVHREMFCDVWLWAGEPRQVNLNIGIKWQQVPEQLLALAADVSTWSRTNISLLEQAVQLHYRAIWIHPFRNGNGRWARLLANILLAKHRHALVIWPEEAVGRESPVREKYITAIKEADAGDMGRLLALHQKYLEP